MSSAVTDSECALATRAIALHGGTNLDVLIGGLGLGYTSKAALDSDRVARVEVVELVQGIIDWVANRHHSARHRADAPTRAFTRSRTTCSSVCAGHRRGPYDLLLIDVDHSPDERLGESSDSFYAHANLALAAHHLRARRRVRAVVDVGEPGVRGRAPQDVSRRPRRADRLLQRDRRRAGDELAVPRASPDRLDRHGSVLCAIAEWTTCGSTSSCSASATGSSRSRTPGMSRRSSSSSAMILVAFCSARWFT